MKGKSVLVCYVQEKIQFFESLSPLRFNPTTHLIREKQCKTCHSHVFYKSNNSCVYCDRGESNKRSPEQMLYYAIKRRAKDNKLDFDLDLDWIEKNRNHVSSCPVLGIPLKFKKQRSDSKELIFHDDDLISLDRIDNAKGYTKENVAFISYRANKLKGTSSLEQISKIIDFLENIKKHKYFFDRRWKSYLTQNKIGSLSLENKKYYRAWHAIKRRAKQKNLSFNLNPEEYHAMRVTQKTCPCFGIDLTDDNTAGMRDNSPHIDRINSDLGYEVDNVIILSASANFAKADGKLEEFKKISEFLSWRVKIRKHVIVISKDQELILGSCKIKQRGGTTKTVVKKSKILNGGIEKIMTNFHKDYPELSFEYFWDNSMNDYQEVLESLKSWKNPNLSDKIKRIELEISTKDFNEFVLLGMPTDNLRDASNWIKNHRDNTFSQLSKGKMANALFISTSTLNNYLIEGMPTGSLTEAEVWIKLNKE